MSESTEAIREKIHEECGLKKGPMIAGATVGAGTGANLGSKGGQPIQGAIAGAITGALVNAIIQAGDMPACIEKIRKEEAAKVPKQEPRTPPPTPNTDKTPPKFMVTKFTQLNTRVNYSSAGRDSMMSSMLRRGW